MSVKTRFYLFWAALAALSVCLGIFVNARKYSDRSWAFWTVKGTTDAALAWLMSWKIPALLAGYISFWASDLLTKDPIEKLAISIVTGVVVGSVSARFKEIELFLGVFAMDMVTARFLYHWNRLGQESREYAHA